MAQFYQGLEDGIHTGGTSTPRVDNRSLLPHKPTDPCTHEWELFSRGPSVQKGQWGQPKKEMTGC